MYLHSLRNKAETLAFLRVYNIKLVQINVIFADNVRRLSIYTRWSLRSKTLFVARHFLSKILFYYCSSIVLCPDCRYVQICSMTAIRHIRKDKRRASVLSLCSVHIACSKYLTKIQLCTYICILIQNWLSTNIISENNI